MGWTEREDGIERGQRRKGKEKPGGRGKNRNEVTATIPTALGKTRSLGVSTYVDIHDRPDLMHALQHLLIFGSQH